MIAFQKPLNNFLHENIVSKIRFNPFYFDIALCKYLTQKK